MNSNRTMSKIIVQSFSANIFQACWRVANRDSLRDRKETNRNRWSCDLESLTFIFTRKRQEFSMHSNWRDCKAWADENLKLSTTSNEACKLYDAAVTQYVGWYDDANVGGLEKTLESMKAADPDFLMGKALSLGLDLMGTGRTIHLDPVFRQEIDQLVAISKTGNFTGRECLHVEAIDKFAKGFLEDAAARWEEILLENPTDLLALKFCHDTYFYLGFQKAMMDSVVSVLPQWKPSTPLYSYLYGMLAFGQVETNFYDQALASAMKGLELNPKDGWAAHAVAHVYEMTAQPDKGINFMTTTEKNWVVCNYLANHNFWHLALYYLEKGEHETVLHLFDTEIKKRASSGALLDIVDMTSLLYRMELEGIAVGQERWQGALDICRPHLRDHTTTFNDAHLLMSCLGSKSSNDKDILMTTAGDYMKTKTGNNVDIMKSIGLNLLQALISYAEGSYSQTVEYLKPIRYKIVQIGGSDAQRDMFDLLLINAALNSQDLRHHLLAKSILEGRKAKKPTSPMTTRLFAKAVCQLMADATHEVGA